jgi:hypothetical protein
MDFKNDNFQDLYFKQYDDKTACRIMAVLDDLFKEVKTTKCAGGCGRELNFDRCRMYDHEGGWGIIGSIPKQWVSVVCECGYHTSLDKLGVSR